MPVAPSGLNQVHINDGTTTQANESAIQVALAKYARDRKLKDASNVVALGFGNGYHGNSIATLSVSDPRVNLQGVPTLNWPRAPFPKIRYPMAEFEHENRAEEDRCLNETRQIIRNGGNVGALIIEPITGFENQMATPYFYRKLRQIALEEKIPFIVDETKTGLGITGKMWAHEHWNLSTPADIVTFGGATGISGFYSTL